MLIDLKLENTKQGFPLDIFEPIVEQSFKDLAKEYSLPVDYIALSALWAVASLSGNMFTTQIGGEMKSILYCMMVGPSSIGKTKAYDLVFGDIIEPLADRLYKEYATKEKDWEIAKMKAKVNNTPFSEPRPIRIIRSASGATLEAITKYASTNPAGFGVYFDEGKKLYQGGSYAKDNNSVDFWNNAWNGKTIDDLRKDPTLENRVTNPAISVLTGMQSKRINEMFNKQAVESGLLNRFLFVSSDYVELNDNRDAFSAKSRVCVLWESLIEHLFNNGVFYVEGNPRWVKFTEEAKILFNDTRNKITNESNQIIKNRREGDVSELLIGYLGKMFAYYNRITLICAIIRNHKAPIIDVIDVQNAEKVFYYFKQQAVSLLTEINNTTQTDLEGKQLELYNALPERFSAKDAADVCLQLKCSSKYFLITFRQKYKGKYIVKADDKTYKKI
jgi:hypothetical protein